MDSTVTLDEETTTKLEELQTEIRDRTGRQLSKQDLLRHLIDQAAESGAEFVDSFRERTPRLSAADRAAFHDGKISSGKETTEEDIDRTLYE